MARLSDQPKDQKLFVKTLLCGDSGTGKTGALASLVKAGYKLGILDMDAKVASGILPKVLTENERDRVSFMSFRDKRRINGNTGTATISGRPTAFANAMRALDQWEDGSRPEEWGEDAIFVLDSTTFLGEAAYSWAEGKNPGVKDPRQYYGEAQEAVETMIAQLTADDFCAHVVVITHLTYTERQDGTVKGYPSAIGKALGPRIPSYFNHLLLAETGPANKGAQRQIRVVPTAVVDAKTAVTSLKDPVLPQDTGLATFFQEVLSGNFT